jgi:hypothetical protein
MLAHIAGIPIEETALGLAPIAAATGGVAVLKLRSRRCRPQQVFRAPVTAFQARATEKSAATRKTPG